MSYGLKVLESAFEHLDIKAGNSDSEDEEIPGRVEAILEPKVCCSSERQYLLSAIIAVLVGMHAMSIIKLAYYLFYFVGSLCGQATSISDWLSSLHGARRCRTW